MYLKTIEIDGFKSFGEKIKIDFQGGITSIVGPNGSGKSNILDAILWVLGEQSYKNIRAKESKDIVFSGGERKKPSNSAEVSLHIDNKDNFFNLDEEIIKVTRKLYSSGQNEYFINNKKVRLKDINDLFMDTGVGKSAYSVIGQGKVERIISSSKKEVKEIIEEAAGVKKFQAKKIESEKNLENVALEIEKIDLILNETKKNRTKIQKQAEKAIEFLEIKKEKDRINKGLIIFNLESSKNSYKNSIEIYKKFETDFFKIKNSREENENNLKNILLEREKLKNSIEENFNKNQELKNSIAGFEKNKAVFIERQKAYERELIEKKDRLTNIKEKFNENIKNISLLQDEKEKLLKEVIFSENKFLKFEKEIKEKESIKKENEKDIENKSREILNFEVEKLQYVNDIESSSRRFKGSNSKINSLNIEIKEINKKIQNNKESKDLSIKNKEVKEKEFKKIQNDYNKCEKDISEISININKISEVLRRDENEENRNRVKYESILRFEEHNDGFFKGVKEILNLNISGVHGALISLIKVPEYLENAIQAAISGNLQDIVVENNLVAKKCIEILKKKKVGRASFLALDMIKTFKQREVPSFQGVIGRASELIGFNVRYQKIMDMVLGNLLVVENMNTAIEISKKNIYSGNIVTLTGELISGSGRITGGEGKQTAISQMFERRKEAKRLKEFLTTLSKKIKINKTKLEDNSKKLEDLENEFHQLGLKEENLKKLIKFLNEECENLKQKEEKFFKNREIFILEKRDEEQYAKEYEKRIKNSSLNKENIEKKSLELKKIIEEKTKILQKFNDEIKELNEKFSDTKIKFFNNKNKILQLNEKEEKSLKEKKELSFEISKVEKSIDNLKKEIITFREKLKEIEETKIKKEYEYEKENREFYLIKEKESLLEIKEKELNLNIKNLESDEYKINEKLKYEKVKEEELTKKIKFYKEEMEKMIEIKEISIKEINHKENNARMQMLTNQLKNFETVNLLAVEEFKELDKKYQFIKVQKEDLKESKISLINLIEEISLEIKKRFYDAYTNINKNFNLMCMETIDNSEGSLVLSNEKEYENCGVEIYVKFKNKKKQSLSLLSGGEKSMVAIAFVMSIFMYKPSPFTFLDEIEAALDEKNTRKLINKLKEFTNKSQFILITHNKETMKSSDTLFGVTMNKKIGISKIVSVKL